MDRSPPPPDFAASVAASLKLLLKPAHGSSDASGVMAKSLKHGPVGLNPEAWVLEPSAWGFVVDVWGVEFDVEDFDAGLQSFPVSARGLPMGGFSFTVDRGVEGPPPEEFNAASWEFDPDQWGFASGWADTTR